MSISYETIVEKCQKYLENVPTIIIGSGFSVPYGLPTMWALGERLKDHLSPIYGHLDEWKEFVRILDDTGNLELTLHEARLDTTITSNIIKTTWNLINEKDQIIFNKLTKNETTIQLTRIFRKLLQSHPSEVNVITANYDKLIEYSADIAGAFTNSGFSGMYIQRFDGLQSKYSRGSKKINLCKVHGSLDWFKRDHDHQLVAIPNTLSLNDNLFPVIVTPGLQKYQETHLEPYRTLISDADRFINCGSCFLCIGYGFNDEHLQPKLIDQIQRHNKPIVIVTRTLSEKGKEILKNSSKFIVFEAEDGNKTKITCESGELIVDGSKWDLSEFIDLWIG